MSYDSGGSVHKRPLDNAPYQSSGGYQSRSVDTKRSRPEMGVGGGTGANNLSLYGPPGGNVPRTMIPPAGLSAGDYPRTPGTEECVYSRRAGNSKFDHNSRYVHLVDGNPSPDMKGDSRGVPGCGRGATDRNPAFDGHPHHQQEARQSGGSQIQRTPVVPQTQHGHLQQSSPQQVSSQQKYNQQPPLQQRQKLSQQQGASAHFKQGQSYPYGTSNTSGGEGYNGGDYVGGYNDNSGVTAVISASSTSIGHAVRAIHCPDTSGAGPPLSASNRASGASVSHSSQLQRTTPGSSASGSAASTSVMSTAGWVFDPATGGYKLAPADTTQEFNSASNVWTMGNGVTSAKRKSQPEDYGTSPQQRQGLSTGSTAADQSSTNAHAAGFTAMQQNVVVLSGPPRVPPYEAPTEGTSGQNSGTETSARGSTSASHRNLNGQSQSPLSGPSPGYDGKSKHKACGASGSIETLASSGGYVVPTASGTNVSSSATAQGSSSTTSARQLDYSLAPGIVPSRSCASSSAKTTIDQPVVQQPAYQSVATTSRYGNVALGGFNISASGYQRPGQQDGFYGREGSSLTAPSAVNGSKPSASSSPHSEKTPTSDNTSRDQAGVALSTSTSGAIGGGSWASSREDRETSGATSVGAKSSTSKTANEWLSSARDISAPKQPVISTPSSYPAQQVALASSLHGNKETAQSVICGAVPVPKASSQPTSIIQHHPVTPTAAGASGLLAPPPLMGSMVGYATSPQGVQFPMPAMIQSSNGSQQHHYFQGTSSVPAPAKNTCDAPVAQLQQPVSQQQQPTATVGQYVLTPQGQAQPHLPQQTWQHPQQTCVQRQPPQLQQTAMQQPQPPPQGQAVVGRQPHPSVAYSGFLSSLPAPGLSSHVPHQQPGYKYPVTTPFVQPMQHQLPKQHEALPPQSPASGFNGTPGPAGVFQANGQGPPPQPVSGRNLLGNHGVSGNGNFVSKVMRNPSGGNSPPQGIIPSQGERGRRERYDHPHHKVGRQPISEANGGPRNQNVVQQQGRAPCDVYLDTGVCTLRDTYRFRHMSRGKLEMESAQGVTHPSPHHLHHRAGLPSCGFYARTGRQAGGCASSGFEPGRDSSETPSGSSDQQQHSGEGLARRVQQPNSPTLKSDQKAGPTEVTARHILIKHKGSRRPASWQDPSGSAIKQRTQAQATAVLRNLRLEIKTEDEFAKVAMAKSDCSSAKRGGDLSSFERGKMQRAFEDAAFSLEVGGVSEVVATDSGVHLIMRTA